MSDFPDDQTIRRLLKLASTYGIPHLEVEEGGVRVELKAGSRGPGDEAPEDPPVDLWTHPDHGAPSQETNGPPAGAVAFTAPLTGIFYRSPKPGEPEFIQIGQFIEEGQTICLIEAMKLFSQVHADRSGVLLEVVAQNGELVHHGDVLMYFDTGVDS